MNTLQHYQVSVRVLHTVASAIDAALLIYQTELKPTALEIHAFYTSAEAKAVYRFIGKATVAAIALLAYLSFMAGVKLREWSDRYVDSCSQKEPVSDPIAPVAVKVVPQVETVRAIVPTPVRVVKEKGQRKGKRSPESSCILKPNSTDFAQKETVLKCPT